MLINFVRVSMNVWNDGYRSLSWLQRSIAFCWASTASLLSPATWYRRASVCRSRGVGGACVDLCRMSYIDWRMNMASACMPASIMDMIDASNACAFLCCVTYLVVGENGVWFCWSAVERDDHAMPLSPAIQ